MLWKSPIRERAFEQLRAFAHRSFAHAHSTRPGAIYASGRRVSSAMPHADTLGGVAPGFWKRVESARRRLLFLDYDGTLAPFHVERARAVPPSATRDRLERVVRTGGTWVAVVSGRPIADLMELLRPLPLTLAGEHGWEEKGPASEIVRHPLAGSVESALAAAHRAAEGRGLGARIERKRTALVLHTRDLPPSSADGLRETAEALWRPSIEKARLRIDRTLGGLELRAIGHDKGTFVRARIDRGGEDTLAVYVGDDRTDEDAFAVLRGAGVGIRVGDQDDTTLARERLPHPEAMADFLDRWIESIPADQAKDAQS